MRKLFPVFCALVYFAFLPVASKAQVSTPPGIEKGWNLISTPCDVSLSELKQKLGNDEILVFDWDGAKYNQVAAMERGRGYLLNSNAILNSSVVCKQDDTVQESFSKTFRKGWNLIGNPYHKSVVFSKMLGAASSSVTDIYEYQGNKLRQVSLDEKAKPFRGYWIFATNDITVVYPKEEANGCAGNVKADPSKNEKGGGGKGDDGKGGEGDDVDDDGAGAGNPQEDDDCEVVAKCDKLVIVSSDKTATPELYAGDTLNLTANCIKGETTTDVTADSKWTVDKEDILKSGEKNGSYTAAAAGKAIVTAEYDAFAASVTVAVKKIESNKLVKIELTAESYNLKIGAETKLKVAGIYDDGSSKDLTADAEYYSSKKSVGYVNKGTTASYCADPNGVKVPCSSAAAAFYAIGAGDTNITASFGGLVSAAVNIKVSDWLQKISVYTDKYSLEPHETTLLTAYGFYRSGQVVDLTKTVEWKILPDKMAAIEQSTARLTPLDLGVVNISASYEGVDSYPIAITIEKKSLRWTFIQIAEDDPLVAWLPCPNNPAFKYCYTHIGMKLGKTAPLYVYGEYIDGSESWIDADKAAWDVTDESILTVDANGVATAKSEGLAGVRVYVDGVYSEWFWVYVYTGASKEFLSLEFSNQETIVEKGKSIDIGATQYKYDAATGKFTASNVTSSAEWSLSDTSKGAITAGIFTGSVIGDTVVTAKYNGVTSNSTTFRVWEPSHLTYCDENNVNEQVWRDGLTIASVESDCKTYKKGSPVSVRFLAQLDATVNRRVLDVCLDLYIYDKDQKLVRTFQNRNCSPTALYKNVSGYKPVYDYTATWDQKDDAGNVVPAGEYTAVSRYYILYCPVLKVKFTIQ